MWFKKQTPESRLKDMLEIDEISPRIVIDTLDTLSIKSITINRGFRCRPEGRSNSRFKSLKEKGFLQMDKDRTNEKFNVYQFTKKGYKLYDIAQKYLEEYR